MNSTSEKAIYVRNAAPADNLGLLPSKNTMISVIILTKGGVIDMTVGVKEILNTFELLSENEKKALASEILRRTVHFDFPPLKDDELIQSAENLFLELDHRESKSG